MDVERAVLKAGVTLAALFAVYQGTQGMQEFAKQRSAEVRQDAEAQPREKLEETEGYIESLRHKESERRLFEAAQLPRN
ncbi:hypothetical protein [Stutzerimonas nitrititolerans]|uniref:hypothetical protein n=1 Tax=Stutzerimonas nitrititolerans TaxID=2482751 RepID=UPI0028AFD13F|nr:hypothetical protein [Stutzerimonas nitrititolerans]